MIELHQYRPILGLPNASPFCMKVEAYLAYRGLPYKTVASSPRKSPSGKVPFVVAEGKTIADSEAIMDHFEAKQEAPLDAHFNARQIAERELIRRVLEQELFNQIVYMRWIDPQGWAGFAPILRPYLPAPMRLFAMPLMRRVLMRRMKPHGLSPNNPEAAYAKGRTALTLLADFLGPDGFAFGDTPGRLDFSLYAFLANILEQDLPSPLRDAGRQHANLIAYCERMKAATFAKVSQE